MTDISQAAQSLLNPAGAVVGDPLGRSSEGARRGDRVVLMRSPQSLAQDMQEEIGFAFQERQGARRSDKTRRSRLRERSLSPRVEKVRRIDEARTYLDRVPDLKARRGEVERLGRAMQSIVFRSEQDLLDHLSKGLSDARGRPDATFLYGALDHIKRQLGRNPDADVLADMVERASAKMLAEHGVEIQKGAVVSEAAALYVSEQVGSASDLRRLYMDEVVEHESAFKTFLSILDRYKDDALAQAIAFLLRAAGEDLLTLTDDASRVRQKDVIDNLYQLEVLNTVRARSEVLVRRVAGLVEAAGLSSPDRLTSKSVLRTLFELASNATQATEAIVTKRTKSLLPDPTPLKARINYLRELREVAAMLPIKVFQSADLLSEKDARQGMLRAIIEAQTVADSEDSLLK